MRRLLLCVCLAFAATFAVSNTNAVVRPVSTVKPLDGVVVGFINDGTYNFTVSVDINTANPHPVTQVVVQRNSDSAVLSVSSFSGSVSTGHQSIIVGTLTVTFTDNGTSITKNLTGALSGGPVGLN